MTWARSSAWKSNRLLTGRSWVRIPPGPPQISGRVAQLVEHLAFNQVVRGSNPLPPVRRGDIKENNHSTEVVV